MSDWLRRLDPDQGLLLFADTGSSGLWIFKGEPGGPGAMGTFGVHEADIPAEFSDHFERWIEMSVDPDVTHDQLDSEGRRLARALKARVEGTRVVLETSRFHEYEEISGAG